ncbi:NlpC/P60 family protein [Lentibacillus halodurans]|uniref:NlpC/P60 family protein n=1 Tax=Lentibacillus halodurans TaxID=237679 RepID=A0A1I0ZRE0_9BACI|nr:C40 family peptidase [Lentibacillus halodurans]SFB26713.1 NlpC/P60 family protein [Lentibacillus halodurans]
MTKQTFDQFSEELWVTAVQVATIWTTPSSPRDMDKQGISNPTDMDKWIEGLTYESTVALSDENRVQTQTLYGEAVMVIETRDDWAHVVIPTQSSEKDQCGYPGWVPLKQLGKLSKHDWQRGYSAAVTAKHAWLETDDGEQFMKLSYMTILPVESEATDRVKVITPHGLNFLSKNAVTVFRSDQGLEKRTGSRLLKSGERYMGLDYFWGGMSSFGYDCSGFAYAMHKANGYQIPRDAGDQAKAGQTIPYDELKPGDLIFFAYEEGKGRLHHVGFYYGDGKMLHSPQTGRGVELIELEGTKYEKELCAAKRYWQQTEGNLS